MNWRTTLLTLPLVILLFTGISHGCFLNDTWTQGQKYLCGSEDVIVDPFDFYDYTPTECLDNPTLIDISGMLLHYIQDNWWVLTVTCWCNPGYRYYPGVLSASGGGRRSLHIEHSSQPCRPSEPSDSEEPGEEPDDPWNDPEEPGEEPDDPWNDPENPSNPVPEPATWILLVSGLVLLFIGRRMRQCK